MKRAAVIMTIIIAAVLSLKDTGRGQACLSPTNVIKGIASWYSEDDPGILGTTANMERFDDDQLTCAIWDIPFNTFLKVTNLENGSSIIVRINDRGPAKRLGRLIDLTKTAFSKIGDIDKGLIEVSIEIM